jgi:hypothetical protein
MPTVTVRPNATNFNSGTLTGAASAHAALSDNSDASYVGYANGQGSIVQLPAPTIPAGTALRSVTARVRAKSSGSGRYGFMQLQTLGFAGVGSMSVFLTTGAFASYVGDAQVIAAQALYLDFGASPPSSAETLQAAEAYLDWLYADPPTTSVTAPTGTITTTSQPTIAWTHTPGTDGGAQTRYEIKLFSAAEYGAGGFSPDTSIPTWTSGVVASAATSAVPGLLPNAVYRAYVRTAQTINGQPHWAAWAFSAFTLNVTGPTVLSVVPSVVHGGVSVAVSRDTGGEAWDFVDVERSVDAGTSWTWVRRAVRAAITGNTFVVDDQEAPPNTPLTYRARGIRVVSGNDIAGDWVVAS